MMTYNASETGKLTGQPVEIYEFRSGATSWRYTSGPEPVQVGGQLYSPVPVERGEFEDSSEAGKTSVNVVLSRNDAVAELFRIYPPGDIVSLTISRYHMTDVSEEITALWVGIVLGCQWEGVTASLNGESASASKDRMGLWKKYGLPCQHVLYGKGCEVSQLANKVQGPVLGIVGGVITMAEASLQADGYYNGGFVYWNTSAGYVDYRMIEDHVGAELTVMFAPHGLEVNDVLDLYPGCDRTLTDCDNKFNNSLRFGGWPFMPDQNPFDGSTIF